MADEKEVGAPNVNSLYTDIEKLIIWSKFLEEWNDILAKENKWLKTYTLVNWIILFALSILTCVSFFV